MKRLVMFLVFLLHLPAPTLAGSIGMTSLSFLPEWRPDCYRPTVPHFFIHDVGSYDLAMEDFAEYLHDAEAYLQCIRNEADHDLIGAKNVVEGGVNEASQRVLDEVRFARRSLEGNRLLLQ